MGTIHTRLKVVNYSKSDITDISIYDTDSFDWDFGYDDGPNFKDVSIPVGESVVRRAEVTRLAYYCPFTMRLKFSDGSVDVFRINQKHTLGGLANFKHFEGSHDITYSTDNSEVYTLVMTVRPSPEELRNVQAEERNKEGEKALRDKQYKAAIAKFDQALPLAYQVPTINSIEKNKSEAQRKLQVEMKVQRLNQQGEEALRRKQYEAAIVKFDQALQFADQMATMNLITNNKSEAQRKLQLEKEVQRLNQRGEEALRRKEYEIAIENFNKALQLMPESWMIKSNKSDACYQYGKSLMKEAQDLEAKATQDHSEEILNKLTQAKSLLEQAEALRHTADQKDNLDRVNAKIGKHHLHQKAKILNKQGEEALRRKQYEAATKMFDEALTLTSENSMIAAIRNNRDIAVQKQRKKKRAQELNNEGEEALRQHQYETAIKKFEQALEEMRGSWLIKSNQADAYAQYGRSLMHEALILEAQDKSEEAEMKFSKTRRVLQQAQALRHTAEQENNLKLIILKIDGNQLFNEAIELEEEGNKLYKSAQQSQNFSVAKKKYEEAVKKYTDAAKKFQEGSAFDYGKFEESARIATDNMESVLRTINTINQAQLNYDIDQVKVNDNEKTKTDVTEETTTTAVVNPQI